MQYLAHPFDGMFDEIVQSVAFRNYVALAPFVVWQSP